MGLQFPLKCANLIAYLSRPLPYETVAAPRVSPKDVNLLVRSLRGDGGIWSDRPEWLQQVRSSTDEIEARLQRIAPQPFEEFLRTNRIPERRERLSLLLWP